MKGKTYCGCDDPLCKQKVIVSVCDIKSAVEHFRLFIDDFVESGWIGKEQDRKLLKKWLYSNLEKSFEDAKP